MEKLNSNETNKAVNSGAHQEYGTPISEYDPDEEVSPRMHQKKKLHNKNNTISNFDTDQGPLRIQTLSTTSHKEERPKPILVSRHSTEGRPSEAKKLKDNSPQLKLKDNSPMLKTVKTTKARGIVPIPRVPTKTPATPTRT